MNLEDVTEAARCRFECEDGWQEWSDGSRDECDRCGGPDGPHPGIDPDVVGKRHDDLCYHLRDDDGCPTHVTLSIPVDPA